VFIDGGWPLSSGEFAALPDGRLLIVKSDPEAVPTRINVIFNWFDVLKAKVPLK
jgi:hypothetical protein